MKLYGFTARVFQHEFDHLDGVLFHDRYDADRISFNCIQSDLICLLVEKMM